MLKGKTVVKSFTGLGGREKLGGGVFVCSLQKGVGIARERRAQGASEGGGEKGEGGGGRKNTVFHPPGGFS